LNQTDDVACLSPNAATPTIRADRRFVRDGSRLAPWIPFLRGDEIKSAPVLMMVRRNSSCT
jgi:hypothetical protein